MNYKNLKTRKLTILDNSDPYLEMAATEKLRYAVKVKQINDELMEHLASSLRWLLHYCIKNNIPIPRDEIDNIIDKAVKIESKLPSHPTTFDTENNRRQLDRTLKQYCYKVLIPYHTVWKI